MPVMPRALHTGGFQLDLEAASNPTVHRTEQA